VGVLSGVLVETLRSLLEAAPFVLLGLLVAGLLHEFLDTGRIVAALGGRDLRSIFSATFLGRFAVTGSSAPSPCSAPSSGGPATPVCARSRRGFPLGAWVAGLRLRRRGEARGELTPEEERRLELRPGWTWGRSRRPVMG
jgi:hypothetical protein